MLNHRRFVRIDAKDILEIRPYDGAMFVKTTIKDFSLMGVCFYSPFKYSFGQLLLARFAVNGQEGGITMRLRVTWSELVDEQRGYLVGTEISEVDDVGVDQFLRYYYEKVKEFFK